MTPKHRKQVEVQLTHAEREKLAAGLDRAKREGWFDMLREPQDFIALAEGCWFDHKYAQHAIDFFEKGLVQGQGEWVNKPFVLLPWQREQIIRPLFGWRRLDPETRRQRRRFRSAFIFVAKKNGKTTLAAGIILYLLCGEPDPDNPRLTEQAQQVFTASTSRELATTLFQEAATLVSKSKRLTRARPLEVKSQSRRIIYPATNSFFRVLPNKARSTEGLIAGGVVLDEVHALKSRELYAALRWAGSSRRQPLFIEITTAGVDDNEALWKDRYRYSKRVAAGESRDTDHLVAIFEADKDAEVTDLVQLRKANPSLGVIIPEATILADARQVLAEGPAAIAEFKRYRMNIAVGASNGWISPEQWDKGQVPFSLDELASRPCVAGLDLAKVSDFTALCLLWPPQTGELIWRAAFWFWLPRAAVEERWRRGDLSYQAWADQGLIEVTEGDTTDHQLVRKRINELAARFTIQKIGIDRNFEGWQFTQDLFNDDELPAVGVGQGWKTQDVPMQRIETLVRNAQLNAGGNPVMRWMVGNAIAARTGINRIYSLDRARASDKVDGVAALINAMYMAEFKPKDEAPGVYEECPLLVMDM